MPLEQHHPHRGAAFRVGGGERHGAGIIRLRCFCLGVPLLEKCVRIVGHEAALIRARRCWKRLPKHGVGVASERRSAHVAIVRSEEHTSELQSLMRISYAVFCLKKKTK